MVTIETGFVYVIVHHYSMNIRDPTLELAYSA